MYRGNHLTVHTQTTSHPPLLRNASSDPAMHRRALPRVSSFPALVAVDSVQEGAFYRNRSVSPNTGTVFSPNEATAPQYQLTQSDSVPPLQNSTHLHSNAAVPQSPVSYQNTTLSPFHFTQNDSVGQVQSSPTHHQNQTVPQYQASPTHHQTVPQYQSTSSVQTNHQHPHVNTSGYAVHELSRHTAALQIAPPQSNGDPYPSAATPAGPSNSAPAPQQLRPIRVQQTSAKSHQRIARSVSFMPTPSPLATHASRSAARLNLHKPRSNSYSGASGTSAVAIDNKIEQAMDLVKSHLMFAVREEVEVLKERISELMDRITQLEHENSILKQHASQETLAQLSAQPVPKSQPPSSAS